MTPQVAVVVPCYNEEAVLPETARRLDELLARLEHAGKAKNARTYLVDDGSRDSTWALIEQLARENPRFSGIKLSRNQGHQAALLAGLLTAEGDAVVSIDADLQDDLGAIERMVDSFGDGYDVVYGVRRSRSTDSFFKRNTAQLYYRLLRLFGVDVVYNHADFRLLSRRALDALQEFGEVNLFLRGIVPLLGYRSTVVEYNRGERFAGESKYPLRKMLALAVHGVTSFSVVPLRLIAATGLIVFVLSFLMIAWVLYGKFVLHGTVPGWASSVIPIYLLGGIQLLSIGVLGEYVAKIYLEAKRRPRYFIEKTVGGTNSKVSSSRIAETC